MTTDIATTLFSDIRARFQGAPLNLAQRSQYNPVYMSQLGQLCDWMRAVLGEDQEAIARFEQIALPYLTRELDEHLHPYNRVITEEQLLSPLPDFVHGLYRGLAVVYRRAKVVKTYLTELDKALAALPKDRAPFQSLYLDGLETRNAQNLLKTLQKHAFSDLEALSFGVDDMLKRKPEQIAPLLELVLDAAPCAQLRYLEYRNNMTNTEVAPMVFKTFEHYLPGCTSLKELAMEQWFTSTAQLSSFLNALPESVEALSLRLYFVHSRYSTSEPFEQVLGVLNTHPAIARLKRLRLHLYEPKQAQQIEELPVIKGIEQLLLQWQGKDATTCPVFKPWSDLAEERRQALREVAKGEAQGGATWSAEQLNVSLMYFHEKSPLNVQTIEALLFEDADNKTARVFPYMKQLNATPIDSATMAFLFEHGAPSFPQLERAHLTLFDEDTSAPLAGPEETRPFTQLKNLRLDTHRGTQMRRLADFIRFISAKSPLFPALESLRAQGNPSIVSALLDNLDTIAPACQRLDLSQVDEEQMTRAFDVIITSKAWEKIPAIRPYVCPYLPTARGKEEALRYWLTQAINVDLPIELRAHILKSLLSDSARKEDLSGIYAEVWGVPVKRSMTRGAMIDALLQGAFPTKLHHFHDITT